VVAAGADVVAAGADVPADPQALTRAATPKRAVTARMDRVMTPPEKFFPSIRTRPAGR